MSPRPAADPAAEQVCKLKASLPLPQPWSIEAFAGQVAQTLGKPIRIVPQPNLTDDGMPCGLVIERVDDIVIAYDAASSGYHGDHIVLHEIAHLLLNHTDCAGDSAAGVLETVLPDCDPASVQKVLARSHYDDVQESQAELFASLVMSDARSVMSGSALQASFMRD